MRDNIDSSKIEINHVLMSEFDYYCEYLKFNINI